MMEIGVVDENEGSEKCKWSQVLTFEGDGYAGVIATMEREFERENIGS